MKKLLSLILSIILICSCVGVVQARTAEEKKTYIVVLDAPSVYSPDRVTFYGADDDMYREALLEMQAEVKSQINGGVSAYSLRNAERTYTYTDVLNGFTVNVSASAAEKIKKIDGVKGVYENKTIDIIAPVGASESEAVVTEEDSYGESTQVSFANSGNMMGTAAVYDKEYNGEGRAIAIIDSTINPDHIYYKLSDESTAKYTKADIASILANNEMNVSATADDAYKNAKIPFAYNYPLNSKTVTGANLHGAHVAGVAAGNSVTISDGVISGVAPEAQILFFSVYDPEEGTKTDDMIAALEDAVKFDVDAINLSMGSDFASEYMGKGPYNDAVIACRNAGKTVVFAAGNSDRASYSAVISDYGTSDNRNYLYSSKVGSIQAEYAYMTYLEDEEGNKYPCVAKGSKSIMEELTVADCGAGSTEEIAAAEVSGKIALITLPDAAVCGNISAYATRAMNAGAMAVVLGYYADDLSDGNSGYAYPLFYVSRGTAEKIAGCTTLKYTQDAAVLKRTDAPRQSLSSSYGYADNLDIAVDFSAPGGNIYSSYGGTNGFANLSGTSMAAPQVTGATSLMYQYVEEKFPAVQGASKVMLVKNLLASTAETVYDDEGTLASPRKVGAGLIRLDKAMETKVILKDNNSGETKINLGTDIAKSFDVTFRAHNLSAEDVSFEHIEVELSSDDYKYYDGKGYCYCGVKNLEMSVSGIAPITVPAGGNVDVTLTVTLSDSDVEYLSTAMTNGFFVDGKVTLSGEDNCDVGIPFSGFYGGWHKLPIMNEKRLLDYFKIEGLSEDGFAPPAQILKENNTIILPVSDAPDASVKEIPLAVYANPIRNAFMTVKCDGVTKIEDKFINKQYDLGYYLGEMLIKDLSEVSTITVELRLPTDTEGANKRTYNISVVKDNTAPVISDVYVSNKTEGDYAYLLVSDDYGVGVVTAKGKYEDDWYYSDAYIKEASATAEFDITDLEDWHYYVYDCAFNMTELAPHIGIEVQDGAAIYTNNTHKAQSGMCMIAVYEDEKMTDFKMLSENAVTIDAYDTVDFDLSSYEGKSYKLFFWKDMKNIVPICESYRK